MATETIDSGGGGDFTTWQAWEDNLPATLIEAEVGQGVNEEISSSSAILIIAGHTTTATFTITVTARAGDSFADNPSIETTPLTYDSANGCALLATGGYASNAAISIQDQNVFVTRLQVDATHSGGGNAFTNNGDTTASPTIDQCIARAKSSDGLQFFGPNTLLKNSLFIQAQNNTLRILHCYNGPEVVNCTLVSEGVGNDPNDAIEANYGTTQLTNCAIFNADTTDIGSSTFTYTDCFTNTSNTPTGCTDVVDTDQFVAAQSDWRLKSGADCIDAGSDDTNGTPSINGISRVSGNYDVGCWEFLVAGVANANRMLLLGVGV